MLPRDLLDLGDLVDYITDLGYAAAAAGEFSLEANQYRAAYDRLYALYREVVSAREIIEAEANAVIPERVSRAIYSVVLGAASARSATTGVSGTALTGHMKSLQAQLATILNGMHHTYATTIGADHDGARTIAGAGQ
ncbi:MAG: hypothetical protein IPJ15_10010 [Actinomycetales bacterium]|nr:hypothetical protein [Candidatus Phosphoribacter baldrii]